MEPPPLVHLMQDVSLAEFAYENPEFAPEPSELNHTEKERDTDMRKVFKFVDLDPYERDDLLEPHAFRKLKQNMTKITKDGFVMKRIEREGRGEIPLYDSSKEKITIDFYYAAYLESEYMPFDIIIPRIQKPRKVVIGSQSIIPGLEIALKSMKLGEKASFIIEPELAYRDGQLPKIPKQATVLFIIDLHDITASNEPDDNEYPTFGKIINNANALCEAGNAARKEGDNAKAVRKYCQAEAYLLNAVYENEEQEKAATEYLIRIYSNVAICSLDLNEYKKVCIAFNNAKYRDPAMAYKHVKLLYNSAKALKMLKDYKEARKRLRRALRFEPQNKSLMNELKQINELEHGEQRKEKELFKKMLNFDKMPEEIAEKETASFLNNNAKFTETLYMLFDRLCGDPNGQVLDATQFTTQEMDILKEECRKKKVRIRRKNSQITLFRDEL